MQHNPTRHFKIYRKLDQKRKILSRSFQLKLQDIQAQGNKLKVCNYVSDIYRFKMLPEAPARQRTQHGLLMLITRRKGANQPDTQNRKSGHLKHLCNVQLLPSMKACRSKMKPVLKVNCVECLCSIDSNLQKVKEKKAIPQNSCKPVILNYLFD